MVEIFIQYKLKENYLLLKFYKYMTAISKNVYIGKLNDIVKKYKYRYNRSIKMKPTDITSSTYINFAVQNNDQDLRFKASGHVRISKSKKHFL